MAPGFTDIAGMIIRFAMLFGGDYAALALCQAYLGHFSGGIGGQGKSSFGCISSPSHVPAFCTNTCDAADMIYLTSDIQHVQASLV
jgi:hypothetical protein